MKSPSGSTLFTDDSGFAGAGAKQVEFQALLGEVQSSVFQYILCLVPNWANAEDIFQETQLRLWEEFDRFEPGTSFRAWALSIAYYQVLTFRKNQQRSRLHFSQEVVDALEQQLDRVNWDDTREEALQSCVQKLPPRSRELLGACYGSRCYIKEIAARRSCSAASIYKALSRIRQHLRRCIEAAIGE